MTTTRTEDMNPDRIRELRQLSLSHPTGQIVHELLDEIDRLRTQRNRALQNARQLDQFLLEQVVEGGKEKVQALEDAVRTLWRRNERLSTEAKRLRALNEVQ